MNGNITAGAKVEAEGDIVVKGMVEPCNIKTSGSLVVENGVVGREDCRIELGGGLQAKYVLDATIFADGDVEVDSQIVRSRIRTRGQILIPNGRITAGEVTAYGGIIVGQVGAKGAAATTLVSGIDYKLAEEVAQPKEVITGLERDYRAAKDKINQVLRGERSMDKATFEKLSADCIPIEEALMKARAVVSDINQHSSRRAVNSIKALHKVFPETSIQIGTPLLDRATAATLACRRLAMAVKG